MPATGWLRETSRALLKEDDVGAVDGVEVGEVKGDAKSGIVDGACDQLAERDIETAR